MGLTQRQKPPAVPRPVFPYPYKQQLPYTAVPAKKNIVKATYYQTPFQQHLEPNFRSYPSNDQENPQPEGLNLQHASGPSFSVWPSSDQPPFGSPRPQFPVYDNIMSRAHMTEAPPHPNMDGTYTADGMAMNQDRVFNPAQLPPQQRHQSFIQMPPPLHLTPTVLPNGEAVMTPPVLMSVPATQYGYLYPQVPNYTMFQTPLGSTEGHFYQNGYDANASDSGGFYTDACDSAVQQPHQQLYPHSGIGGPGQLVPQSSINHNGPPMPPAQLDQRHIIIPGTYGADRFHSKPGYFHCPRYMHRTPVKQEHNQIRQSAISLVETVCPALGEKPYCLPPVNRSRHPDKSNKQLVLGLESEKRVLGSFERFFAERQLPVFMLCHYPMFGFMRNHSESGVFMRQAEMTASKFGRDTLTLLLLSDKFSATLVMVSVISGSSDFAYIQRGVQKAAALTKRCGLLVSEWLKFLGVNPMVRQIVAFPNLKKAMMQRITKDKQYQENFGNLCTLHVDDLSAPFEEEWSTPVHKHLFSEWMQAKVLCHGPTLSREDLHLVVGALLSPRLSSVSFIQDLNPIDPIPPGSASQPEKSPPETSEDVSQLSLTIDGVTKPFDEFMDEYVQCYYPHVETESYRVPPIHFNIQSFKKATDYLKDVEQTSSSSDTGGVEHSESENSTGNDFMPPRPPYQMSAGKESNCTENAGPNVRESFQCEGEVETESDTDDGLDSFQANKKSRSAQEKSEIGLALHQRHRPKDKKGISSPRSGHPHQASSSVVYVSHNSKSKPIVTSAKSSPLFIISSSSPPPPITKSNRGKNATAAAREGADDREKVAKQMAALQGVEMMSEVMTKDTRADEGENRVISALELLSHQFGPMFIICGYQYNNYLNKLREEMFSKGEVKRPIRAFGQTMRAEHDCLIFHKKYGAIVVCIKAIGDNFSDWGASEEQIIDTTKKILEKAVKQLEREEAMIKHVTSDLHSKMACHKLIALPNMDRQSVQKALDEDSKLLKKINDLTGNQGADLFLCQEELPAKYSSIWDPPDPEVKDRLVQWWKRTESALMRDSDILDTRVYRQVIGRYCGLLSTVEVWSQTNPRMEVRSLSEAVHLCAERFHKVVLLPHQIRALCSNERRVFLYGPPGCGKTLVLHLKAKEWLLAGEKVILINSRPNSTQGYPFAYGVFNRLKTTMSMKGVQANNLFMINIDSLKFKASDLAGVLPSCCIIMDEVTASSHEIIEHLCCLQVRYIWCAGLFEDDRPVTAHRFTSYKMNKILRCPPIVQSLLKHTEPDVRFKPPYQEYYQSSVLLNRIQRSDSKDSDKENIKDAGNKKEVPIASEKTLESKKEQKSYGVSNSEVEVKDGNEPQSESAASNVTKSDLVVPKHDAESLNKRLKEKYGKKVGRKEELALTHRNPEDSEFVHYNTSSAQLGLATDGPRPVIIDHCNHDQPGNPMDCRKCAETLAEFLESMVKSSTGTMTQGREQLPSKNKFAFKASGISGGRTRLGKSQDSVLLSNSSTIHTKAKLAGPATGQKLGAFFDSKALTWSDVLIVAREVQKDCPFVSSLRKRGIPLEVLLSGVTHAIETSKERKLFITSYKEVTGMERALIVFVPVDKHPKLEKDIDISDFPDLQLGQSMQRLSEEDRTALWYVASRSLASLVLILP